MIIDPRKPELKGQIFGYWFGPEDTIPKQQTGRSTGAVLAMTGIQLPQACFECLDLIPIDNYWMVMSGMSLYTYRHSSGIQNGEPWCFVPVPEVDGPWPVVYKVVAKRVNQTSKLVAYGPEAAERCQGEPVTLRLHREVTSMTPWTIVRSTMGRRLLSNKCPYCAGYVEAYAWSLAGSGKRCSCGAKLRPSLAYWDK